MKPTMIFIGGSPCTGKTTLAEKIAKEIPSAFLLDKDTLNKSLSCVVSTNQEELPPIEQYLAFYSQLRTEQSPFGETIELPWGGEFYGRHVAIQSKQAMLDIAKRNLALGKSPIYEAVFGWEFEQEVVQRIFSEFENNQALIYVYCSESVLRQRMTDRLARDSSYQPKDGHKLLSEEIWREEMQRNPVLPKSLEKFPHIKINTEESLESCTRKALKYLHSR